MSFIALAMEPAPLSNTSHPVIRDNGSDIVERLVAFDGIELAVIGKADWYHAILITPGLDSKPKRSVISAQSENVEVLVRRLEDMHATVCAMQAAGFVLPSPALQLA